jgi:hypothetical protein
MLSFPTENRLIYCRAVYQDSCQGSGVGSFVPEAARKYHENNKIGAREGKNGAGKQKEKSVP